MKNGKTYEKYAIKNVAVAGLVFIAVGLVITSKPAFGDDAEKPRAQVPEFGGPGSVGAELNEGDGLTDPIYLSLANSYYLCKSPSFHSTHTHLPRKGLRWTVGIQVLRNHRPGLQSI